MSTFEFLEQFGLLDKYQNLVQNNQDIHQNYQKYLDGVAGTTSFVADQSLTMLLNNPPTLMQPLEPLGLKFQFSMPDPTIDDTQLGLNFVEPDLISSPPKSAKKIILKLKMADLGVESGVQEQDSPKKRRKRSVSSDGEHKKKKRSTKK